jgi:preprotein translocase subunit SecY
MLSKLKFIVSEKNIRDRIFFIVGILFLFRVLSTIPIPGVDTERLSQFLANSQLFGILNIFSAGGISTLSLVMLGVGPYITASIIMQLMTVMSPRVKAMYKEEGEIGRRKFTQYSRYLTIPLAVAQGYALLTLLSRQGVLGDIGAAGMISNLLIITAGSMLLMWLGELISEKGIGNGVSVIIFAGIVATLPRKIAQTLSTAVFPSDLPVLLAILVGAVVVIAGVIFITEAERKVPITYAKQVRGFGAQTAGGSTYIPLRLNQAGVIPIIFALSLFTFPQMLASLGATSNNSLVQSISSGVTWFFQNQALYAIAYFLLVFGFTYMYTAITFEPQDVADNLQKSGAFIPGVRPGEATAEYIGTVLTRVTFVGALFLGVMAVLPVLVQSATGLQQFAIGGTSLLIAVSVVLDIIKKLDAQISMREY